MKVLHIYPNSCEYSYPKYLDPKLHPDKFDLEIICQTDLEVRYLRGLHELGVECILFYPRRFHLPIKEFIHRGEYRIVRFPITFFEGKNGWEFPLAMLKYIKKERPDLVHFHGIFGGKYLYVHFFDIVAFFCKINKIPLFGWHHMGRFPRGRRLPFLWIPMRVITASSIRMCAGITSINHDGLRSLFDPGYSQYCGIDFSMIPHCLTPNTFDRKMFHPVSREEALSKTGLDKKTRYILMVGRLCYQKGLHNLLNIMPELLRRFSNIHLLIIGDFIEEADNYRKLIMQKIKELEINEHLTLLGRVEHQDGLQYYYNVADVFVLPSHSESFAAVVLEAIACRTPVVATDCIEIPYILNQGVGIIVPRRDENALLDAIERILVGSFVIDEEEREKILMKYDYRTAALSLKNWYENILIENRIKYNA